MQNLRSPTGLNLRPPAVQAQSPNHRTAREFPDCVQNVPFGKHTGERGRGREGEKEAERKRKRRKREGARRRREREEKRKERREKGL